MNVQFKTIDRIMGEVIEKYNLNDDTLEYYTDIIRENEHIIRAYSPEQNKTYLVKITKPKTRYVYNVSTINGEL